MLQQRPDGRNGSTDKRWYSPHRDIAYCWQGLVEAAADGLAETNWQEWFKGYFQHVGVTEEELGRAIAVYVQFMVHSADPDITTPREALEKAGWFELSPGAQAGLCLKLGQVMTCTFFSAIRDVTFDDQPPQVAEKTLMEAARRAQTEMTNRRSISQRLRRIFRRMFPWLKRKSPPPVQ